MIQKPCKKCMKYSEAVSHGAECPWCSHPPSNLNFDPWTVVKVLAVVVMLFALIREIWK